MHLRDTRARHHLLFKLSKHTSRAAGGSSKFGLEDAFDVGEGNLGSIVEEAGEFGLNGLGKEGGVGTDSLAWQ